VTSPGRAVRALCAGGLLAFGLGLLLPSLAAATDTVARDTDGVVSAGADPGAVVDAADDDDFDGRSTRDTVRFVVGSLVAIAGVTAVSLLVFVWHTSPSRRQRIAVRRADRSRAESHEDELSEAGEPRG
jgi:hypothetical protein